MAGNKKSNKAELVYQMIKFTILCENTVLSSSDIIGEHGLSVLIEKDNRSYLFDTGQGMGILHNAMYFKKDLSTLDQIFLSHGHYDHTGGLLKALKQVKNIKVHGHSDIFLKRFAMTKRYGKDVKKDISIPEARYVYESMGANFVLDKKFREAVPGIWLTGEVPRLTSFEKGDSRLVVEQSDGLFPDHVNDDQALAVETPKGLAVILGCAHSGMINTLTHIVKNLDRKIYMVVGGTHTGFLDKKQLDQTIDAAKGFSIEKLGVSHCSGITGAMRFMQEFGKSFFPANAGVEIEV
ncbi:MAG: MBL fold metallo-hydrolase [Deltaproteobacteria bacterium]|nr:MBL fold metallo-hydrolase [Deltaproteobacteria bacterium]